MFDSLLDWCTSKVLIHRYLESSASGDKVYALPVEVACYRVDDTQLITDKFGESYMSHRRFYIPGTTSVTEADMLSIPEDTEQRVIRRLGGYIDGSTNTYELRVAYL